MGKSQLLYSAACFGMVVGMSASANAQTAPSQASDAVPAAQQPPTPTLIPAQTAGEVDAQGPTSGDIVVTAQKRSEKLKDVPATLLVRTNEQLLEAGVRSPTDLTNAFPGLTYSNANASAQPAIRGITTAASAATSENPVAVYIDGIYQPGQSMTNGYDLSAVSSVDVLKGPQGTVFGRNVVAGAVLVQTRDPEMNRITGSLEGTIGEYGGGTAKTALNNSQSLFLSVPVIDDHLAVSLSVFHSGHEGWLTDLNPLSSGRYGSGRKFGIQGKILWQPNSSIRLLFNARYYDEFGQTGASTRNGISRVLSFPDGIIATKPWQTAEDVNGYFKIKTQSYSLRADFTTDIGTITSLTSYQKALSPQVADTDAGYSPKCSAVFACYSLNYAFNLPNIVSQEIDFASRKFGGLSFVAGVFAFSKNSELPVDVSGIFIADGIALQRSFAGFTEFTYDLTPKLTVIGGVRYTYDTETTRAPLSANGPESAPASSDWTAVTTRAGLKYRASDSLNLYATFSQGYQSGFNTSANNAVGVAPTPPVSPQRLNSYEIGAKFNYYGSSFNLSAFHYDYTDIVVQRFTGQLLSFSNAAAAKVNGVDADWNIKLTSQLHLSGGISWLPESKFTNFANAPVYQVTGNSAAPVSVDLTGSRMIRSPKVTLSLGLDYDVDVGSGKLHLNGQYYHTDGYQTQLGGTNNQNSYDTLGARIAYNPDNSRFRFSVYGRNLTNKAYLTGTVASASGFEDYWAPPREIGASVGYKF